MADAAEEVAAMWRHLIFDKGGRAASTTAACWLLQADMLTNYHPNRPNNIDGWAA
jgi:hypothetical protein